MGLLTGRTRKQSTWQTDRTGPSVIKEKHDTNRFYYNLTTNNVSQEISIGSISAIQKARVLRIYVRVVNNAASTPYYLLNIDGNFWTWIENTSGFVYEQNWDYENAPDMRIGMSLYVNQVSGVISHNVVISVLYTLEPVEDGYYTPN